MMSGVSGYSTSGVCVMSGVNMMNGECEKWGDYDE